MHKDIDSKVYEFSGFRLEKAQRRLLYQGKPIQLKPKILDLLLFLVETRGQLIEKEDLMREIWHDAVVEDNNITVSISHLRKILREDRLNPRFIETVPRRGYRSVAEVVELPGKTSGPLVAPQTLADTGQDGDEAIDSLAVLPMEAPEKDVNVEYLSDGIVESIINMLSRIPKLRVLACSTVFQFKSEKDPQKVGRSEEHTSELQSQSNLVCRLLLEKKKKLLSICS